MRRGILAIALAVASVGANADTLIVNWQGGGSLVCDGKILDVDPDGQGGGVIRFDLGDGAHYEPRDRLFVDGMESGVWNWHIYSEAGDDDERARCTMRVDGSVLTLECAAGPVDGSP
jgi:hypothetical protein